ncbi:NAD dependent epimerase/dehydratase family protein [Aspergillus keveii]|uniref:NAD dependent epimerase/dehydratase family protein n=1 Tax=Aspergillus keveii TaxID=714993 RepID=A0ABR4FSI1_9EURO
MAHSILITGVSGYIGGSILAAILDWKSKEDVQLNISALVRSESQASVIDGLGVQSILVKDFDELEKLEKLGEEFDIIIHAGAGWHTASAKAFIRGLSVRRAAGKNAHYIQISGTSNLSDRPHSANFIETRTFSDEEDIYSYEKSRETDEVYYQRTTDINVVETGEALLVPTSIVMAPTIFGLGTGPLNKWSVQLPAIIANALERRQVKVLSEGQTVWTHVHIEDLTDLFVLLARKILGDENIPSGRKGIYFCETGEHTHLEIAQRLADAGADLGLFSSADVKSVRLQEAADAFAGGNMFRAELSFGANARSKAVLARKMGWKPSREGEWVGTFATELKKYVRNGPTPKALPRVMRNHE